MSDNQNRPEDTTPFETDEVAATRGREQGLGVGARELAAQRDPGDVQSRDDEDAKVEADDPEALNQTAKSDKT